jgi:hypothetical protein
MLKGKNLNIFVRFGGTNIKRQKGFRKSDTFHSPPATKGFYAMPLCAQEFFLLGSMDVYQPGTMPKPLKGNLVGTWEDGDPKYDWSHLTDKDWDNHAKRRKKALSAKRKQFYKKTGNIWHHLAEYTDRKEIIAENNSWVKTSIQAWQKAFAKMSLKHRYGEKHDSWDMSTHSINQPARSGITGMYSKDHCEVFFDEKV